MEIFKSQGIYFVVNWTLFSFFSKRAFWHFKLRKSLASRFLNPEGRVASKNVPNSVGNTTTCITPVALSIRTSTYLEKRNQRIERRFRGGRSRVGQNAVWCWWSIWYARQLYGSRVYGGNAAPPRYSKWIKISRQPSQAVNCKPLALSSEVGNRSEIRETCGTEAHETPLL